jgi:hypothetical protein
MTIVSFRLSIVSNQMRQLKYFFFVFHFSVDLNLCTTQGFARFFFKNRVGLAAGTSENIYHSVR